MKREVSLSTLKRGIRRLSFACKRDDFEKKRQIEKRGKNAEKIYRK